MMATKTNRLPLIDSLRGFALLGVLIVHITSEFSGWGASMSPEKMKALPTAATDDIIAKVVQFFVTSKARALFAFLFGCAFFFQLSKAEREGVGIAPKFVKRMALLFIIGLLHTVLLWSGDIFVIYAICGLLLLLFYKKSPKALFIWGVVFTTVAPLAGAALRNVFPYTRFSRADFQKVSALLATDDYGNVLQANWLRFQIVKLNPYFSTNFMLPMLGCILLGYWAMRVRLFQRLVEEKRLLRRCLSVSLPVGLLFMTILLLVRNVYPDPAKLPSAVRLALAAVNFPGNIALAFAYVCGFAWLYRSHRAQPFLNALVPAGQMTLTNYVMQSAFAMVLFYGIGLGWMGTMGPTITLPIGIGLFGLQVVFSWWWLRHFNSGPLEWLWRSALQGKWLPIVRRDKKVLQAAVQPQVMNEANVTS